MTQCYERLDKMLKPAKFRYLLEKRGILLSIVEDVTQANAEHSERFKRRDKVPHVDIRRLKKDIPRLEKKVQKLLKTVKTMNDQRRDDRVAMLKEVEQLYGAPILSITDCQRRSLSPEDSKKALPLLLKFVQHLDLEFTIINKKFRLLKISETFQRGHCSDFSVVLREAPYCKGTDRQGAQLAAEIDDAGKKRLVGFHMHMLSLLRAIDANPLGHLPEIPAPPDETIDAVFAGPHKDYLKKIDALMEKSNKCRFKRFQARDSLDMAVSDVFGTTLEFINDARVNALPLNECKQTLQTIVKLAQNLCEETVVCAKYHVVLLLQRDFWARERKIYKDALYPLLKKLYEQEVSDWKAANADKHNGPLPDDQQLL